MYTLTHVSRADKEIKREEARAKEVVADGAGRSIFSWQPGYYGFNIFDTDERIFAHIRFYKAEC